MSLPSLWGEWECRPPKHSTTNCFASPLIRLTPNCLSFILTSHCHSSCHNTVSFPEITLNLVPLLLSSVSPCIRILYPQPPPHSSFQSHSLFDPSLPQPPPSLLLIYASLVMHIVPHSTLPFYLPLSGFHSGLPTPTRRPLTSQYLSPYSSP